MPSPRATLGIILVWLAAVGWTVYRAARERGQPPPITLDLLAEVGAENGAWEVLRNGKRIGTARTEIRRRRQRPLVVRCYYSLDHVVCRGLTVKSMSSNYGVTPRGAMRDLYAKVTLILPSGRDRETEIRGRSESGFFTPVLKRDELSHPQPSVAVAAHGQVLNVLHPLHKMAPLSPGQTWRMPLLDPLEGAALADPKSETLEMRTAVALVETAALEWEGKQVPCWRIDYREESGRVAARVWARIPDGTILQHEANPGAEEFVLVRKPTT